MGMQTVWAGIDVSASKLVLAVSTGGSGKSEIVANDADGHRALIKRLQKLGNDILVAIEATGNYGLDLAMALHVAGIQVMVINPRAVAQFGKALLQRSKTDRIDAEVILEYVQRMPFEPWRPPARAAFELRTFSRRIHALKALLVEEKNRLHAAEAVAATPDAIISDLKGSIASIDERIERLENECLAMIAMDAETQRQFALMVNSVGYGVRSAIKLLGELAVLPHDMTARQWVAHAGLDPRQFESGASVTKPDRISKAGNAYLRGALYLPAVTAIRCNPNVKAFYDKLIARGKKPMQAQIAVMRKMLHSIHAMFRTNSAFDGEKFYSIKKAASATTDAA